MGITSTETLFRDNHDEYLNFLRISHPIVLAADVQAALLFLRPPIVKQCTLVQFFTATGNAWPKALRVFEQKRAAASSFQLSQQEATLPRTSGPEGPTRIYPSGVLSNSESRIPDCTYFYLLGIQGTFQGGKDRAQTPLSPLFAHM